MNGEKTRERRRKGKKGVKTKPNRCIEGTKHTHTYLRVHSQATMTATTIHTKYSILNVLGSSAIQSMWIKSERFLCFIFLHSFSYCTLWLYFFCRLSFSFRHFPLFSGENLCIRNVAMPNENSP